MPRVGFPALPSHGAGQAIGLLGGSFNPPHAGHLHITELALKRLKLDAVWWLVSPGNPLKEHGDLAPFDERVRRACEIADHPRIRISAIESQIGENYTADTLAYVVSRAPDTRFVWLMGADGLANFHRWRAWQRIAALMPLGIIDRPGWMLQALASPAARRLAQYRRDEANAPCLARMRPPGWLLLFGPRSELSSTAMRG